MTSERDPDAGMTEDASVRDPCRPKRGQGSSSDSIAQVLLLFLLASFLLTTSAQDTPTASPTASPSPKPVATLEPVNPTATAAPADSATTPTDSPSKSRPNFLFIFSDDVGFGDLKSYGHPYAITDNLDKLASEGTSFRQFHVAGNVCPTSRAGLMTSRNPSLFPNWTEDYSFLGAPTVTKLLQSSGYYVGHIGKWNIGDNPETEKDEYGIDHLELVGGEYGDDPRGREGLRFDAAIKFVEENADKAFYLNLWIRATHTPIDPPSTLIEPFKDLQVDRDDFGFWMQEKFDEVERKGGNINRSMREYLATVYGMDLNIGRLLDKLDELGIADNTVVIFSSDNGPEHISSSTKMVGYSGGLRGEKHNFFEGGTRVPFIVRWPGHIPANFVNDQSIFSGLDWLPTICGIAECNNVPWELIEGEDMSDVWKGESMRSRTNPLFFSTVGVGGSKFMRYGNWKMHESPQLLYDLSVDPTERDNVWDEYPDIVDAMRKSIAQWEETLPDDFRMNGSPLPFDPTLPLQVIGPPEFAPTASPFPSSSLTVTPSLFPSAMPTEEPSSTMSPSDQPTAGPTITASPTATPTSTASPTTSPTAAVPSDEPSASPSSVTSASAKFEVLGVVSMVVSSITIFAVAV